MENRRKPWWRSVSARDKILIIIFILLIILITAIIAVFASKSYFENEEVCNTPGCAVTAGEILKIMDRNVDPCEDFYEFACGKWISETDLGDEMTVSTSDLKEPKTEKNIMKILDKSIEKDELYSLTLPKRLYKLCMDEDEIEIRNLTEINGILDHASDGWPVVKGSKWSDYNFNWAETLLRFASYGIGIRSLISLEVETDLNNSSRKIIMLGQPYFNIDHELLRTSIDNPGIQLILKYMIEVAMKFGAHRKNAVAELSDALKFELHLASITKTDSELRDNLKSVNNVMNISELQRKYNYVNWLDFIRHNFEGVDIDLDEKVLVLNTEYFTQLGVLLRRTQKRVIANYIVWNVLQNLLPYLPKRLRDLKMDKDDKVDPRWKQCTEKTIELLPNLVGALYVRNYFDKESKEYASEISRYLREVFLENLKTIDWMAEETKNTAIRKANAMTESIAYPEELLDDTILEKTYGEIRLVPRSYLMSVINIGKFEQTAAFKSLRNEVVKTDWKLQGDVTKNNAYYTPQNNMIQITAAILQGVIFNKNRPRYVNFGSLGWVLGHELTHGFDTIGSQFDEAGNFQNWWDEETKARFNEKTSCFIEQYSKYNYTEAKVSVNGDITKDENIADNGGLKVAYAAYKKWVKDHSEEEPLPGLNYTPNQLFWLAAAQNFCEKNSESGLFYLIQTDSHTRERYRIIGAIANSEDFARDYQCPVGSAMNPPEKCTLW